MSALTDLTIAAARAGSTAWITTGISQKRLLILPWPPGS